MNDSLQNALAGLADQLGVTTAQLWDWLQGYGIEAYAKATIATTIPWLVVTVAVAVATSVMTLMFYRRYREDLEEDPIDMLLFALIPGLVTLVDGLLFASALSTILGWMASPEGMVLRMLAERFGQ